MKYFWNFLRWVFATYFLGVGIAVLLVGLGIVRWPEWISFGDGIDNFLSVLRNTKFMFPLMGATYVLAAIALFGKRTAHLGLMMLAPVMAIIFLTHFFLGGSPPWASGNMAILLALIWHHRKAYAPLFDFVKIAEDQRT